MESKKPEFDEALGSTYSLRDPEMERKRPQHDGASSSRCHESESPQQEIERISDAFFKFYEPSPASSANLDIFFFHGLECEGEYARDAHLHTWKSSGEKEEIWAQKWLPKDFPQARIISVCYDCYMKQTDTEGRMDLYLIGENIVQEIKWARQFGYYRPVIFVGHGFGGIVIKKLCVFARSKTEKSVGGDAMSIFLESIRGFFFYGTPHLGVQGMESPTENEGPLVRWMRTLNSESVRLHEAFSEMLSARRYRWTIYGLGEAKSKFGRQGLQVSEASTRFGDRYITVSGDHFSVCRPSDRSNNKYKHLQDLIREVQRQVPLEKKPLLLVPKITVGVDALLIQLGKDIWDHQFVRLCGVGGVGKTTLSKLVFNQVYVKFEYWEKMLHHGVPVSSASGSSGGDGWFRVNGRSLLVVFDDVEDSVHVNLLKEIAHENGMEGSRFILTSRDSSRLEDCGPEYEIYICKVDSLEYEDANKLFITYAFPRQRESPELFKPVVKQVVDGCEGLPLTLEVLGNYIKGKKIEQWKEIPVALKECDNNVGRLGEKVWSKLQLSYDRLPGEEVKQMFLDVASYFVDSCFSGDDAIMAWNSLFRNAHNHLQTLEDRALVRSRPEKRYGYKYTQFYMHEHLRRMGQRIAGEKGRIRSIDLSREDQELGKIVAHNIDMDSLLVREGTCTFCFMQEFLPKLTAIRYMDLSGERIHCCLKCRSRECPLSTTLVLLHLHLARTHLARTVNLVISAGGGGSYSDDGKGTVSLTKCTALVKLDLLGFNNVDLGGMNELRSMRVLKIYFCGAVQHWPTSFRGLMHLERLELTWIDEPFELPTAFGDLVSLQHLSITLCEVLSVPSSLSMLTSLRHLEISKVIGQQPVPDIIGPLRRLQVLRLECLGLVGFAVALRELTAVRKLILECEGILELSDSLGSLTSLEELELSFPKFPQFQRLPEAIWQLSNLQSLSLENWNKPDELDEAGELDEPAMLQRCAGKPALGNLRSLQKLKFSRCEIKSLPESLGRLSNLTYLSVQICEDLETLPETIGDLASLTILNMWGCKNLKILPETIGNLSNLEKIGLSHSAVQALPKTIGNLCNLEKLNLSYSAIQALPNSLRGLSKLRICIEGCKNLKLTSDTLENFRLEETFRGNSKYLVAK